MTVGSLSVGAAVAACGAGPSRLFKSQDQDIDRHPERRDRDLGGGRLPGVLSFQNGFTHYSGWELILPTNSNGNFDGSPLTDGGIFYRWLPDLPIDRAICASLVIAVGLALITASGPRESGHESGPSS